MMPSRKERLQSRLEPEIEAFRTNCRSLLLATVNQQGIPNVSYAPFVLVDGDYYILISEIARHAKNLQQIPQASMMMVADESDSRQIFARQRLTYQVNSEVVYRETEQWLEIISALQQRHGDLINQLSQLKDFSLFRLRPLQGLYVKGFGQAFQVSSDNDIDFVHLQEGHQPLVNSE